ncbi:MAG: nitroreductase/quinone reductase family protein [Acidimicrobiia bacterium]
MTLNDIEKQAIDNPQPWARQHIDQYLASEGRDVDPPLAERLILLYTKGKKSGRIRRVPVVHFPDGDDLIVIASKGGAPQHPSWFFNLKTDPQVWVRNKASLFEARAEILHGEEHENMWARVVKWAPGFQQYQDRTERQIPLVRLRRIGA